MYLKLIPYGMWKRGSEYLLALLLLSGAILGLVTGCRVLDLKFSAKEMRLMHTEDIDLGIMNTNSFSEDIRSERQPYR